MPPPNKKAVRKLVTLPAELAERVELFRTAVNAPSESDALKTLIEDGLKARDTRTELFRRCESSTANSQNPIPEIINLTSKHPLVARTIVESDSVQVILNASQDETDDRFRFCPSRRTWHWERYNSFNSDWEKVETESGWDSALNAGAGQMNTDSGWDLAPNAGARSKTKSKTDLDDDIPF